MFLTPSTTRISPQTYWLARLARKTIGPAKSNGSPQRAAGMRSVIWRKRTGSANNFSFLGRNRASACGLLWLYETKMKFENREGVREKIRLRTADGPKKFGVFGDVPARPYKRGNRDYTYWYVALDRGRHATHISVAIYPGQIPLT